MNFKVLSTNVPNLDEYDEGNHDDQADDKEKRTRKLTVHINIYSGSKGSNTGSKQINAFNWIFKLFGCEVIIGLLVQQVFSTLYRFLWNL